MKFSKLTFLSVLILLFAFISSVGLQAKETDMFKTDEDIKQKDPELCAKLMEKIKEDNAKIKKFADSMFKQEEGKEACADANNIAGLMEKDAIFVTSYGKPHKDKDNIKKFWKNAWKEMKEIKKEHANASVEFKAEVVDFSILDVKKKDPEITQEEKQIAHIAYVIIKYSYIIKTEGGTIKNDSCSSVRIRRHTKECDW